MAENSKIEWCDHTLNPWIGCTKVSPACDNCYAAAQDKFRKWTPEGWGGPRKRTSDATWRQAIKWNAGHDAFFAAHGRRQRVFCASLADVFDNQVDDAWRLDLANLIAETPNLDWLLLTKRIGNVMSMCGRDSLLFDLLTGKTKGGRIWLGATIANQEEADRDIPKLLAVPARVRFLSMEPLLGPVDLRFHIYSEPTGNFRTHQGKRQFECARPTDGGLHWVITGGESGPGARPSHPAWYRNIRDQCIAAGVAYLHKQNGEFAEAHLGNIDAAKESRFIEFDGTDSTELPIDRHNEATAHMVRVGKKAAGRLLDGRTWDGFPS